MAAERIMRFYVTRINKENGEITYINYDQRFNGLFSARGSVDDVEGFEQAADANAIIGRLNAISEHFGNKYEYYHTRRDENTFPNIDSLSDDAKRWFNGDEVVEESTEEGTTEGE